ncbi:hypothetical protein H2200_011058 [Cladophialophora chaetospira]|uniref:Protein HRI1 n=1 Tax=Cladophialophora chaetospira TaxID=386627 RepID=A0AA38WZX1_9EURO|nr:hypothetical protein H2200_011058 [Cladophialophora chaetospira]
MSSRLSTRLSIRWIPGEPSEPTDTLVMSVGGWYVDLRITKKDGSIDWAMAGERLILAQEPWYTEPDIGSFQPVDSSSGSDSLESGSMINPETNVETPYEEVWRSLPATSTDRFGSAWILHSMDKKTFLGQVGGDFLALKGGSEDAVGEKGFCARRENWDEVKECWTIKREAGDSDNLRSLPSMLAFNEEGDKVQEPLWMQEGKAGDTVEFFGEQYILCALQSVLDPEKSGS